MRFKSIILLVILPLAAFSLSSQQWQVQDLSVSRENELLQIIVETLKLPFYESPIKNINYQCKSSAQIYPIHQCKQGVITATVDGKNYSYGISGWMDLSQQQWSLTLENTNKSISIHSNSAQKDSLEITLKDVKFKELENTLPMKLDLNGELSALVNAQITIDLSHDLKIAADYHLSSVNYEGLVGDYVLAEVDITGNLSIAQMNEGFSINNSSSINKGEALAQDIYVLIDDYPVAIKSQFNINNNLEIHNIKANLSSKNEVFIDLTSQDDKFEYTKINFLIKEIKTLHQGFLASYFEILGIDDLEIIGHAQGSMTLEDQNISALELNLTNLFMAIESKKINVNDLNAQLQWQKDGEKLLSQFHWDELVLAGMPIQNSELDIFTQGQQLWVEEETSIPVFDGRLVINKLVLDKIFDPEISIDFSGEVKPISIALITEKMGWPSMNGTLSGLIPGMKKVGHSITFDGVLDIDVFDGQMQVENLSIERLFGIAPVVAGDIVFNKLNLQQITSTYDFGEITGLVKGYVRGLRITNWKADRLDAHIESVKTKDFKQTISQRAIDNISSIGGIQGALSRSFLRFFDYFKYKKIGIGCKLRNSICQMSGIDNKKDNYTIIQGRGIPSINIIGFRKFIDWEVFIDRLLNAGY